MSMDVPLERAHGRSRYIESLGLRSSRAWIESAITAAVLVIGMLICAGWAVGAPNLLQLTADSGYSRLSTGLVFVLLACSRLATAFRFRGQALIAAGVAAILAGGTYVDGLASLELGIDTIFPRPLEVEGVSVLDTRQATTGFVLTALCLAEGLWLWRKNRPSVATTAMMVIYAVVGGLAIMAIVSYLGRGALPPGTNTGNAVPLYTVLGIVLLISGRIAALWSRDVSEAADLPQWFIPSLALGFVGVFLGLMSALSIASRASTAGAALTTVQSVRLGIALLVSIALFLAIVIPTLILLRRKTRIAIDRAGALSDEIARRRQAEDDLERRNAELTRSNQDLEDFAYIASHDLKAPMRGIDNAAKWLEEDLSDVLTEETRKTLDLMRNRIARMERLLDDLLSYARAGRADAAEELVDIDAMLWRISDLLALPDNVDLTIEGDAADLRTAGAELEQVVRNLIQNAVKHNDKANPKVTVSVNNRGEMYEFSVRDNGPGIAPEFHDRIFKLFQTLKRRDEVEGSGMGLAVVKKLVARRGGQIGVLSSGNGGGADFRFTWRVSRGGNRSEAYERS